MESAKKHHGIIVRPSGQLRSLFPALPSLITARGDQATRHFIEFFTANIRNRNTREAYARAAGRFFAWCESKGLAFEQLEPTIVAGYIEQLGESHDKRHHHRAETTVLCIDLSTSMNGAMEGTTKVAVVEQAVLALLHYKQQCFS